jgi:uncharacterized membrane protein
MIGLNLIYPVAGLIFAAFALLSLRARRLANAAFHGLIATSFFAGDLIGDVGNGVLVLAVIALGGSGVLRRGESGGERPAPRGNGLFAVALLIPVTALVGTLLFKQMPALVDPRQATLVALILGVIVALAAGYAWLRPKPLVPFEEGRRLLDDIGWAVILPQMLASLGAVFALAGVGTAVGGVIGHLIPGDSLFGAVLVYCGGMALFTMAMGNAFAAFPVMAAAIGLPLLIGAHHGNPAPIAAIGMLAGFCGTLMTPMAANFNLVPAALLELKDRNGVVKMQVGTALPLLVFNIILLWWVLR